MKPKGWVKEPVRHGLASKGIKTKTNPVNRRMEKDLAPLSVVRDNYERTIIDAIDWDGYDLKNPPKTNKEKLQFLKDRFKTEYGHEIERRGEQGAYAEWLSGVATNLPYSNFDILQLAKKNGSLPQNPTEKQEDRVIENYWNYMTNQTFRLFRKYGVK